MELNDAICGRRAIRQYTDQVVDEATLRGLSVAATQAPSANNQQPWAFTVVRDAAILDLLSQNAKSHLIATLAASAATDHAHGHVTDANFPIFYHAPVLIFICATAQGPWIVQDCALAAENLMLAAYAAGLGSCWIGLAQSFLETPGGREAVGTPVAWIPVAPIIVGHARGGTSPVARRAPVMHWVG